MNCTSCKAGVLTAGFIDGQFKAHTCTKCGGIWILVEDFVAWKDKNPDFHFPTDTQWSEDEAADSTKALLCPMTGVIMRKCKVTAKTSHRIDYSHAVGGIWLDKGEWQLLKAEGVAGVLNNVVTQQWQNNLRSQSASHNFAEIYEAKFGGETYAKIKEIRAWLDSQPNKADLRAYLFAENPYSATL